MLKISWHATPVVDRCAEEKLQAILEELQKQTALMKSQSVLSAIRESRDAVLTRLAEVEKTTMSGFDDLKAAVASTATTLGTVATDLGDVGTKIDTAIALIEQLKQSGGLSDADAEALAQTLTGAQGTITAAQSSLDAEAQKLAGE